MNKIHNYLFNFCFVCILAGLIGMFTSRYAIDLNYASASAGGAANAAAAGVDAKIAFVKGGTAVAILNLKDGSETVLPEKFAEIKAIALSPAKDSVAVAGKRGAENGIFIAAAVGAAVPVVTSKELFYNAPSFSADGKLVVYTVSAKDDPFHYSNVAVADIAKKAETMVTAQKGALETAFYYNYPKFTPDAKSIICSAAMIPDMTVPRYDTIHIQKLAAAGGKLEATITGGATVHDENGNQSGFKASVPTLLADGRIGFLKIVANVDRSLAAINPADPKSLADLSAPIERMSFPSFSADGKFVVFEIFNDDEKNPASSINLYDVTAKTSKIVAPKGNYPVF